MEVFVLDFHELKKKMVEKEDETFSTPLQKKQNE
jgi:hypothetical protein